MRQIKMLLLMGVALLLWQSPLFAQAAKVASAEYFIDADPGYGSGKPIPVTSDTSVSVTISVPTTGLSEGFHTLFVRAKDDKGAWGLAEARVFYLAPAAPEPISPVSAAEYFVDADPGYGKATALTATAGDTVDITRAIPTTGLAAGFHTLFVRAQNQKGTWGLAEARVFYLAQPVTVSPLAKLEYFYDQDPGYGSGTAVTISQADTLNLTRNLSTQGLAVGSHLLIVRAQNAEGVWGMGEAKAFTVEQAGAASISPTSLTFSTPVGSTSQQTFTIANRGAGSLSVTAITKTGADTSQFRASPAVPPTLTIRAGDSTRVTVTFAPTSAGAKAASLSIAHDALGSPTTVTLSGQGVGVPAIRVSPSPLAMDNTNVGATSQKTLTITNTGTGSLSITAITKTGADTSQFRASPVVPPALTLNPGDSTRVTVTFAPTSAGAKSATLSVAHNAAGSPSTVALTGTGVGIPTISLSVTSLRMDTTLVGTTSQKTFTISNTGTGNLSVTGITAGGADASQFTASPATATIAPGQSQTVTVTFAPTSAGAKSASLSVAHNATGSPSMVALTGTGRVDNPLDVNNDGAVNIADVILVLRVAVGDAPGNSRADVNRDGRVDALDSFLILLRLTYPSAASKPVASSSYEEGASISLITPPGVNLRAGLILVPSPGQTPDRVEVTVRLTDAAQVQGYSLRVRYDASRLELVGNSARTGSALSEGSEGQPAALQVSPAQGEAILADVLRPDATAQGDGDLVRLTFRVLDKTVPGRVEIAEALVSDASGLINGLPGARLEDIRPMPSAYVLSQNYPNPFNPATQIVYQLPQAGEVTLVIYNALGQQVRALVQGRQEAGYYRVTWDGKDAAGRPVSSGLYFYRLMSGGFAETRKMLLLK